MVLEHHRALRPGTGDLAPVAHNGIIPLVGRASPAIAFSNVDLPPPEYPAGIRPRRPSSSLCGALEPIAPDVVRFEAAARIESDGSG